MDQSEKSKLPRKLAMLSVPLAVASPALADLPATAEPASQIQNSSDANTLTATSNNQEVSAAIPQPVKTSSPTRYRVRSGDTVTAIAKRFGLTISQIARLNNLGPNSLIRVGQVLRLSPANTADKPEVPVTQESYRVKSGDTLTKIAKRFGLTVPELTAINRISSSTIIYPGQVLRVTKVIPAQAPIKDAPDSYQVAAGDTLESIATRFGLRVDDLRQFNSLTRSSIIYVGQQLHLKKVTSPAPPALAPIAPTPSASTLSDEISSVDPMRPSGACTIHGFHTVKAGETVSRIAAIYGVSTQSVLSANNLSWSSTIYVGQQLTVPGVHDIMHCPTITKLNSEMRANAEVIYNVGKRLGVNDYGIVIALATAMQESSLRNINYGDRDSLGLFQQRPSMGWGSAEQIMNPEYAARAFFGGPTGPNAGKIRGLLDIKNWSTMQLTKAAQAVQISAFPDAYQKWELSAWSWLDSIESTTSNG